MNLLQTAGMPPFFREMSRLLLFFVSAALLGATIAWPLWQVSGLPYDKVLSRSVLLATALLMIPFVRIVGLDRQQLGWSPVPLPELGRWWLGGIVLILPPAAMFVGLGFRVVKPVGAELQIALLSAAMGGLVGGLLAALLEELVFRGALLALVSRFTSVLNAMLLSSILYGLVHFLQHPGIVDSPSWWSGYPAIGKAFVPLANPAQWWDSLLGLSLLGVLLCLVRLRTGSLLPCIALHAAWIFFLRIYKEFAARNIDSPFAWLAGSHDNFTGLLVAAWLLTLILVIRVLDNRTLRV